MKKQHIPTLNAKEFTEVNYKKNVTSQDFSKHNVSDSFEIHRIEEYKSVIKFPLLPHRKTIHDFIFLTKGEVCRGKGLDTYRLHQHQIFFLPAHNITCTDFVSNDAMGYYCHFTNDILNNPRIQAMPFFDISALPISDINEKLSSHLTILFERLINIKKENTDLISVYLQTILTELSQHYKANSVSQTKTAYFISENFKNSLLKNIYTTQTVKGFAELLSVSPNHLNKCVKSVTGKTVQNWINEMIVLEAKVLLRQTNKTISEIAFELTNQDVSDFGRFFKHKTGFTPSQFREMD